MEQINQDNVLPGKTHSRGFWGLNSGWRNWLLPASNRDEKQHQILSLSTHILKICSFALLSLQPNLHASICNTYINTIFCISFYIAAITISNISFPGLAWNLSSSCELHAVWDRLDGMCEICSRILWGRSGRQPFTNAAKTDWNKSTMGVSKEDMSRRKRSSVQQTSGV